jgi:hypothetical protein
MTRPAPTPSSRRRFRRRVTVGLVALFLLLGAVNSGLILAGIAAAWWVVAVQGGVLLVLLAGVLRRQRAAQPAIAAPPPAPEVSPVRALAFRLEEPIERLRQQERQRFIAGSVSFEEWSAREGVFLAARAEMDESEARSPTQVSDDSTSRARRWSLTEPLLLLRKKRGRQASTSEGEWSAAKARVQRLEQDYHAGIITWGQLDLGIDQVRDDVLAAVRKRANLPEVLERMPARSDPVNLTRSRHPAPVTPREARPVPGARVSPRVTDPGILVSLMLTVVCAGVAFGLLAANLPSLQLALTGATTTGVVQYIHDCDQHSLQPTVTFFDTQGREHVGTGSCGGYALDFAVPISSSPADPDGGIVLEQDTGGVFVGVILGGLFGLAGLIGLGFLVFRIKRQGGVAWLSRATWLTALVLVVLLAGTLGVFHLATQHPSYRHYHVGETATTLGGWTVTVRSARVVQVEESGQPSVSCLVFEVVVRNTSSRILLLGGASPTLYALTFQQLDAIPSQQSDDPNRLVLFDFTKLGGVKELNTCPVTGPDLSGDLAPGDVWEGQVAFSMGELLNVHLFWLAFRSENNAGAETETIWDLPGSIMG